MDGDEQDMYIRPIELQPNTVPITLFIMLRPLHFVVFLLAISFALSVPTPQEVKAKESDNTPIDDQPPAESLPGDDLEPDATYWGYARPWGYPGWGWGRRSAGWVGPVGGYWRKGWVGGWNVWG